MTRHERSTMVIESATLHSGCTYSLYMRSFYSTDLRIIGGASHAYMRARSWIPPMCAR
ncbi:hypothetical protein PISMIDRAFT_671681 [Pisolithus microcarpus 441]|uniref:Uncharacterized protein n=1 Tax=Pisolithus microcarpus 441 TaxID=765257 RepID=A0A0D0ACD7_9AGAM|nr:hypothetical protein PISMIDRAFT_671681 [Pisolithus microcarpus 441]